MEKICNLRAPQVVSFFKWNCFKTNLLAVIRLKWALSEKCPYSESFTSCSGQNQNNTEYGHFLRSGAVSLHNLYLTKVKFSLPMAYNMTIRQSFLYIISAGGLHCNILFTGERRKLCAYVPLNQPLIAYCFKNCKYFSLRTSFEEK